VSKKTHLDEVRMREGGRSYYTDAFCEFDKKGIRTDNSAGEEGGNDRMLGKSPTTSSMIGA